MMRSGLPASAAVAAAAAATVRTRLSEERRTRRPMRRDLWRAPVRLSAGLVIEFSGTGPGPTAASPPFRLELGIGRRISGRLVRVDDRSVRLEATSAGDEVVAARAGARAVVQRMGEVQVLDE